MNLNDKEYLNSEALDKGDLGNFGNDIEPNFRKDIFSYYLVI